MAIHLVPLSMSHNGTATVGESWSIQYTCRCTEGGSMTYTVYRKINDGDYSKVYSGPNNRYNFIPTEGTTSFQVKATATCTHGEMSGTVETRVISVSPKVYVKPSNPSSISYPSTAIAGTAISVSWGSASCADGGSVTYRLHVRAATKDSAGSFSQIYSGSSRSYTYNIPANCTELQFQVDTRCSHGQTSSGYRTGSATKVNRLDSPVTELTVPVAQSGQTLEISWTGTVPEGYTLVHYKLERSVNQGAYEVIYTGEETCYTDQIETSWATVQYRVCGVYAINGTNLDTDYNESERQAVSSGVLYTVVSSPLGEETGPFEFGVYATISGQTDVTDIQVTISVDGRVVFDAPLDQGETATVGIDPRVLYGGGHEITVEAAKEGHVTCKTVYPFTTPSFPLPVGGIGAQLKDKDGGPMLPQTAASLVAGIHGSVASDLHEQAGKTQLVYNSLYRPNNQTWWERYRLKTVESGGQPVTVKEYLSNVESDDPDKYPEDGWVGDIHYRKHGTTTAIAKLDSGSYTGAGAAQDLVLPFVPKVLFLSGNNQTVTMVNPSETATVRITTSTLYASGKSYAYVAIG